MHLRRLWIVGLFAAFAADAAVIYKWTDADGVVHYSDQAVPGAEKIVTAGSPNVMRGAGARASAVGTTSNQKPAGLGYSVCAIESPAKEQVFFGDEIVPVRLHVDPSLKANQAVTWHLNGKQLDQAPEAVAFALQSLPRGTYAIAATVTDIDSGESQSTDSITFYVRQPSELSPQHRKP